MPYRWKDTPDTRTLTLWPHQSLTAEGFAWFIGPTAALLCLPLLAVLGSPVVWVLMGFFALTLWGTWRAIMANRRSRQMHEELVLSNEAVSLSHAPARGATLTWKAHPDWVTVHLHDKGPVEHYLTLRGGGREVELGRFLTPEERIGLYDDLRTRIRA